MTGEISDLDCPHSLALSTIRCAGCPGALGVGPYVAKTVPLRGAPGSYATFFFHDACRDAYEPGEMIGRGDELMEVAK